MRPDAAPINARLPRAAAQRVADDTFPDEVRPAMRTGTSPGAWAKPHRRTVSRHSWHCGILGCTDNQPQLRRSRSVVLVTEYEGETGIRDGGAHVAGSPRRLQSRSAISVCTFPAKAGRQPSGAATCRGRLIQPDIGRGKPMHSSLRDCHSASLSRRLPQCPASPVSPPIATPLSLVTFCPTRRGHDVLSSGENHR